MITENISCTFKEVARAASFDYTPAALRLALCPGEALTLPKSRRNLRVLSGNAWISRDGRDMILDSSQQVRLPVSRDVAVISPVGLGALLFEVW